MRSFYFMTVYSFTAVFLTAVIFYIVAIVLRSIFQKRNKIRQDEIVSVIEKTKTKNLVESDNGSLVAIISAAISEYTGMSESSFNIKSIKASTPVWGFVERLRQRSNIR